MQTTTMVSADNIDLKPQNIGFSADGKLKLFDFGLAACVKKQQLASDTYEMTGFTGTLVYMAPEVYLNQPYNEKVDVYSFAMILWELISGEQVFSNMSKDEHMQEVVLGGQRPSLSPILARAPAGVARLLELCWHAKHQRRPDFASIERDLLSICDDETAASTPSSGCEASPAPIAASSSGGLGWSSMFQRNGGRNIHSSTSDFNRDLNQAAKMKVSAKKKTKPVAPRFVSHYEAVIPQSPYYISSTDLLNRSPHHSIFSLLTLEFARQSIFNSPNSAPQKIRRQPFALLRSIDLFS